MRKRLYFILPDIKSAHSVVNELLLARIDDHHIHIMAKEGTDLGDLPEATIFEKSDIIHGLETGLVIGGIAGLIGGVIAIAALQLGSAMGLVVLGCTLFGAVFGSWTSGMIGSSTPNSRLVSYARDLANGKILIMVDAPFNRAKEINKMVRAHHSIVAGGTEPSMPAFP